MSATYTTRFAPSPTGRLHLGHAWSALCGHDAARASGGRFLVRMEDIDAGRCRTEFVDGIYEDLTWLGLDWDGEVLFQSSRTAAYAEALAAIIDQGFAYKCWCTRAEIAASLGAPQEGDQPIYPGLCKGRADPGDGRPFAWRLDVKRVLSRSGRLFWHDAVTGEVEAAPERLGDVVIARKDAPASYHLAVVIDDAFQEVTDVVRGLDLFQSTHIHRLLQHVLGLPTPNYHHHALVVDREGCRLAKRKNSPTIQSFREAGMDGRTLLQDMRNSVLPDGFSLSDATVIVA